MRQGREHAVVGFLSSGSGTASSDLAHILALEARYGGEPPADTDLLGLAGSRDRYVRQRAVVHQARRANPDQLAEVANLLAEFVEEHSYISLALAQLALVQEKRRRVRTARMLAEYAVSKLSWFDSPDYQLFVLAVAKKFGVAQAPYIDKHVADLEAHGWRPLFDVPCAE